MSLALGASGDSRLHDLTVHSVVASDDGGRLVVRVVLASGVSTEGDPLFERIEQTYQALGAARAWLRLEVAADIHRKRAPELDFQVFPSWEAAP